MNMNYKNPRIGTILYEPNSYNERIFCPNIDNTAVYMSVEEFNKLENQSIKIKLNKSTKSYFFYIIKVAYNIFKKK